MESRKNGTDELICRAGIEAQTYRPTWGHSRGWRGWGGAGRGSDMRTPRGCSPSVTTWDVGCGGGRREAPEGAGVCVLVADSHCCAAETITTLKNNYPLIKKYIYILYIHTYIYSTFLRHEEQEVNLDYPGGSRVIRWIFRSGKISQFWPKGGNWLKESQRGVMWKRLASSLLLEGEEGPRAGGCKEPPEAGKVREQTSQQSLRKGRRPSQQHLQPSENLVWSLICRIIW